MAHFNRKYFTCSLSNCSLDHYANGLCRNHYARELRYRHGGLSAKFRLQGGFGGTAEDLVSKLLIAKGATVKRMPYNAPFDILVNGTIRVEVKAGIKRSSETWAFNIHRHGTIDERCDWYVCVLMDLNALWVVRAPVNKYQLECGIKKAKQIQGEQNPLSPLLQAS